MVNAKLWNGKELKGEWTFSLKIDGVRALVKDGAALSRKDKPLHNLEYLANGDYEIFDTDWETTVSFVKTKGKEPSALLRCYSLDPLCNDLYYTTVMNPSAVLIKHALKDILSKGHEGLVLRQGDTWLKVKPSESHDVGVIDILPGKGKHEGKMGALLTAGGKVGTGFTNAMRDYWWINRDTKIGTIIQVKCMSLTKDGKFRHPVFERERFDK